MNSVTSASVRENHRIAGVGFVADIYHHGAAHDANQSLDDRPWHPLHPVDGLASTPDGPHAIAQRAVELGGQPGSLPGRPLGRPQAAIGLLQAEAIGRGFPNLADGGREPGGLYGGDACTTTIIIPSQ
jgi:hypothetical protein